MLAQILPITRSGISTKLFWKNGTHGSTKYVCCTLQFSRTGRQIDCPARTKAARHPKDQHGEQY
jgi:hypothetical protein